MDKQKIAYIFPGQGSQYPGMGEKLYNTHAYARQLFDQASEVTGFDLLGRHIAKDKPQEFFRTTFGQPAILALSVIAFRTFRDHLPVPAYLSGHSLGEYSALVCADAIDFHDALKLVRKRSEIMESMGSIYQGTMSAIDGVSAEAVMQICEKVSGQYGYVGISNFNSVKQCVISGLKESVKIAGDRLSEIGGLIRPLNLNIPFHSHLLEKAEGLFEQELCQYEIRLPRWPVISNVTARPYGSISEIRQLLKIQIMQPVKWLQIMDYLVEHGVSTAIEFGPKQVLKKFFADSFPHIQSVSVEHDITQVPAEIRKVEKEKSAAKEVLDPNEVIKRCLVTVAATKNCNNDPFVALQIGRLYEDLKKLKESVQNDSTQTFENAKNILSEILDLKKVPLAEKQKRLEELCGQEVRCPVKARSSKMKLFCFPYAGGSAQIFKEWGKMLPDSVEVIPLEYPGRGGKAKEPILQEFPKLLSVLMGEIEGMVSEPFALFGHSLGAVIAYEISKALRKKDLKAECVILSGCPAPHQLKSISTIRGLNDVQFLEKISNLNGTPPELLLKEDFRRFFIPILRADFSLLDDYYPERDTEYDIPLLLYGGDRDPKVEPASIKEWERYTKSPTEFSLFSGDHFFIRTPEKMLQDIAVRIL